MTEVILCGFVLKCQRLAAECGIGDRLDFDAIFLIADFCCLVSVLG